MDTALLQAVRAAFSATGSSASMQHSTLPDFFLMETLDLVFAYASCLIALNSDEASALTLTTALISP